MLLNQVDVCGHRLLSYHTTSLPPIVLCWSSPSAAVGWNLRWRCWKKSLNENTIFKQCNVAWTAARASTGIFIPIWIRTSWWTALPLEFNAPCNATFNPSRSTVCLRPSCSKLREFCPLDQLIHLFWCSPFKSRLTHLYRCWSMLSSIPKAARFFNCIGVIPTASLPTTLRKMRIQSNVFFTYLQHRETFDTLRTHDLLFSVGKNEIT